MSKSIDLGRSLHDAIGESQALDIDEPHYPDLMLSDVDDLALAEMPDKGEATIKYRVVSRTHREEGKGKEKRRTCSLRLEILSITPPERKKKNGNGYGDDARKAFGEFFKDK